MGLLTVPSGGGATRRRLLDAEALGSRRHLRTVTTEGGHHRIAEAGDRSATRARSETIVARGAEQSSRRTTTHSLGLSARNRLHGFVEEVRVDGLLAQVRLRVGNQQLTAVITADAVRALKLRRGDDAIAVVKSTEVMIAKAQK